MNETYTFSRALHMMRYGGKKMKPINSKHIYMIRDENLKIMVYPNVWSKSEVISSSHIIGSWVEVKE